MGLTTYTLFLKCGGEDLSHLFPVFSFQAGISCLALLIRGLPGVSEGKGGSEANPKFTSDSAVSLVPKLSNLGLK
jgi:hypothetical protein